MSDGAFLASMLNQIDQIDMTGKVEEAQQEWANNCCVRIKREAVWRDGEWVVGTLHGGYWGTASFTRIGHGTYEIVGADKEVFTIKGNRKTAINAACETVDKVGTVYLNRRKH